jgi:PKD domain
VEVRHINRSSSATRHPKVYTGTKVVFSGSGPCGAPSQLGRDLAQVSRLCSVVLGMDRRSGYAVRLSSPRGTMPRWVLAVGMAIGLLLATAASGHASTQDQGLPTTIFPGVQNSFKVMAQTFTAGTTGQIDKVSLALETHSQQASGWLQIRAASADGSPSGGTQRPTAATLISINFPLGNSYNDFPISPSFPITAGTQYAIVWTTNVGIAYWWGTSSQTAYTAGQGWFACSGCGWSLSSNFSRTQDLAFETWVAKAAAVAVDHPSVNVSEGAPAANTGTYSDPGGHTVTFSASSGAVTKTGTSSGTWSWSAAGPDEGPSQKIIVTADDGNGLTSTTSFTVNATGTSPTATITAPGSTPEGTTVSLSGTATSPSAADNAAGFTYGWNVTKNGTAYASGSGASWQFTPDEGTYAVTMKATDDGSMSATPMPTATVTAINVAPTVAIAMTTAAAPLVGTLPQQTLDFAGSFTDPGRAVDTYTTKWNFGDGTSAAGLSASHAYTAAGNYNVSLSVTDEDGVAGTAATTVQVQSQQQALTSIKSYVQGISTLNKGQMNSLTAKLDAATASAARGDNTASHNQLSAFLNEVRADVNSGKISPDQAAALTGAVHAVEAAVGTYNKLFQWWPLGL